MFKNNNKKNNFISVFLYIGIPGGFRFVTGSQVIVSRA